MGLGGEEGAGGEEEEGEEAEVEGDGEEGIAADEVEGAGVGEGEGLGGGGSESRRDYAVLPATYERLRLLSWVLRTTCATKRRGWRRKGQSENQRPAPLETRLRRRKTHPCTHAHLRPPPPSSF